MSDVPGAYRPSDHTSSPAYRVPEQQPPTGFVTTNQPPPGGPPSWWRRRSQNTRSLLIAAGALAVGGALVGGMALAAANERGDSPGTSSKAGDVRITSCQVNGDFAVIGYTVTNSASRTRDYRIKFEVRDMGATRVGDGGEVVSDVAPGSTVRGDRTLRIASATSAGCVVGDVD